MAKDNHNFYEICLPNGELRRVHLKDGVPDGIEKIMQPRPRDTWTKAGRWRMEQMLAKALNRDPHDDTAVDVPWTIQPTPEHLLPDNVVAINPKHRYRHSKKQKQCNMATSSRKETPSAQCPSTTTANQPFETCSAPRDCNHPNGVSWTKGKQSNQTTNF